MATGMELLPLEGSKSEHFGFPAKEDGKFVEHDNKARKEVFCRICVKAINYRDSFTITIVLCETIVIVILALSPSSSLNT